MTVNAATARAPRSPQWLVRVVVTLVVVLLLAAGARALLSQWTATGEVRDWLAAVAFAVVGGRIAYRRPDNLVGWLFLAVGATAAAAAFAGAYGSVHAVLAWLASWLWWPAYGLLPLALLLFPEGRLPGRRWQPGAWLAVCGLVAPTVGFAATGLLAGADFLAGDPVDPHARPFLLLAVAGVLCAGVAAAAGVTALAGRWRRAVERERRQLSWPLAAACAVLVGLVLESLGVPGVWVFAGAAVPVAAAVAIVRHGLYDLGTLLSRTITYAVLTALLAGLFAAVVVVMARVLAPVTAGVVPEAVGALAVAVAFQPVRRRVQRRVDRRFNRARYDASRAVEGFAVRLRQQVELDALTIDLLAVLDATVQPARRSLWLQPVPAPRDRPASRAG